MTFIFKLYFFKYKTNTVLYIMVVVALFTFSKEPNSTYSMTAVCMVFDQE